MTGRALAPVKLWFFLSAFAALALPASGLNLNDSVALKYTYRPEQVSVVPLRDGRGRLYLPLPDVAKFYGVELKFDAQTRRIFLSKGSNQVKLVLSQPMFLISNPTESFPTEPAEVVSGQLAVTPETAQDLFTAILGIDVQYQPDQQALIAGGVKNEAVKTEIVAQEQKTPITAPSVPASVIGARGEEEPVIVRSGPSHKILPPNAYAVRRIVIDPGHGGRDTGARGYDSRYFEKQATLAIGLKVAALLRQRSDIEVLLTRDKDYFVTLKGRTQFANKHHADLFVSIHCNSTPRSKVNIASGTEIYVYSPKASSYFDNVETAQEITDDTKFSFANDLHYEAYKDRSIKLAELIWQYIHRNLGQHMRHVQQRNFYVLGRVDMPSILVETAFISNPKEEFKLRDPAWQDKMARSISDGILAFKQVAEGSANGR